jgi:hypothetical protein
MYCIMQETLSELDADCMKALIAFGKGREWFFQFSAENPHGHAEMLANGRAKGIRTGIITPWHDLCLYSLGQRLRCSWMCGKTS